MRARHQTQRRNQYAPNKQILTRDSPVVKCYGDDFSGGESVCAEGGNGEGPAAFGEAVAVFIAEEGRVEGLGRRIPESTEDQYLPGCGREQVFTSDDFRDVEGGVIDRRCEFIGRQVEVVPNEKIAEVAEQARQAQEEVNGADNQRQIERLILLQVVDSHWKEHLLNMDHLKEGIGLRGYGQKNPLNEYKKEAFNLFGEMIETVKQQTIKTLMHVRLVQPDEVERLEEQRRRRQEQEMRLNKGPTGDEQKGAEPIKREGDKIGRNAPCPCGSGKKYKKCCGQVG